MDIALHGFDEAVLGVEAFYSALQNGDVTSDGFVGMMERLGVKTRDAYSALKDVAKQIADYLQPKLVALWHTVRDDLLPVLVRLWKEVIEPLIPVIGTTLVWALGLAIDALNLLLTTATPVMNFLLDHKETVLGIATAFGLVAVAMNLNAAFDAVTIAFNTFKLVTIPSAMATLDTFKAAVAAPMVMPAIAIGAALIAFQIVQEKAEETRRVVEDTQHAADNATKSNQAVIQRLNALMKNGTPEQKARAKASLQKLADAGAFASGTNFAPGGVALVGERGPELVELPRGSRVHTAEETRSMASGQAVTNVLSGTFNFANAEASTAFWDRIDKTQRLARLGMA
jgi:hypothetical protein